MNENYVQGFMDKCAALGVDPEALLMKRSVYGKPPSDKVKPVTMPSMQSKTGINRDMKSKLHTGNSSWKGNVRTLPGSGTQPKPTATGQVGIGE